LLADKQQKALTFEPHERSLFINLPAEAPDRYASGVVVEFNESEPMQVFYR
jgi:hypothetical protein